MGKYVIEGGLRLNGKVTVSGAKNSALSIIAASLLSKDEIVLDNVPQIKDIHNQIEIIKTLGAKVNSSSDGHLSIDANNLSNFFVTPELACKSRGSVLIWGALLSRYGVIRAGLPGGDRIGERPVNFFVDGCRLMGATVNLSTQDIEIKADTLHGAHIFLDRPSTTTTENFMILASLAEGITTIDNAEKVPEIIDLANFLKGLGVKIVGAGTSCIKIKGLKESSITRRNSGLSLASCNAPSYRLIPDPFEAGTYAVAAAINRSDILISNAKPMHMIPTIAKLKSIGAIIKYGSNGLQIQGTDIIHPLDIYVSAPYPAFQSDMQAILATLLCKAKGLSTITDSVFGARFCYTEELKKMGAKISCESNKVTIKGIKRFVGANVTATDIRGGASLILAGLTSEEPTIISNSNEIDRGYENICAKLRNIGANINKVEEI